MVSAMAGVLVLGGLILAWLQTGVERPRPSHGLIVALLLGHGLLLGAAFWLGLIREIPLLPVGLSLIAVAVAWWKPSSSLAMAGLGAAAGVPLLAQTVAVGTAVEAQHSPTHPLFMMAAIVGLTGACLAWSGLGESGALFASAALFVGFANYWTPEAFGKLPGNAGSQLAIAILGALILVVLLGRKLVDRPLLSGLLGALLVAVAGFLIPRWSESGYEMLSVMIFVAVVASFICTWMSVESAPAFRTILGGMIWLAVAAVAYSQGQSFAIALSLLAGAGSFALFGNVREIALMGPAAGLLAYRTFYAEQSLNLRGFDIAQHYGLIGVLVGTGVILLAALSSRGSVDRNSVKGWLRFACTALLIAAAIFPALTMLGEKGTVGLLAGFGLGLLFCVLERAEFAGIVAFTTVFGAIASGFGRAAQTFDSSRDEKVRILLVSAVAIAVILALFFFALRPRLADPEVAVEAS